MAKNFCSPVVERVVMLHLHWQSRKGFEKIIQRHIFYMLVSREKVEESMVPKAWSDEMSNGKASIQLFVPEVILV